MDNGDKFYLSFDWAVVKDGKPKSLIDHVKGAWVFTGGTGKLKGIRGKGTYTATEAENGGVVNMEGEYAMPAARASEDDGNKRNEIPGSVSIIAIYRNPLNLFPSP
jgi:hypothetical protein